MDSNKKPLPPPPPPPPPPPKKGNTKGRPPLLSMNPRDEGDCSAVGAGVMEAASLCHGSPRASCHELSGSSRRHDGRAFIQEETKMPSGSLVGCPGRDEATVEQRGLPRRHSRVVARLGFPCLGTVAAVDHQPYACADCSMTFGRETALCGHMRSHKRAQLSSESEEDAPKLKRRKKRKSVVRTMKPLEASWGNTERRNGFPKDTPIENQSDENSVIVVDDDDDDANPVVAVVGSRRSLGQTLNAAAAFAMRPAPAVAMATPVPAPHATAASLNIERAPTAASAVTIPPAPAPVAAATITRAPPASAVSVSLGDHITSRQKIMEKKGKEKLDLQSGPFKCNVCNHVSKTVQELSFHTRSVHPQPGLAATAAKETTFEWIRINNIDAGVNGPYNAMGRRIPAGAPTNAILALPASRAPIHQPPQGTMAMAGNPHFSAANTSTDRSFPGTTSNILPAIPLHNQEQNPQEQMAAVALGNHGHHSINPEPAAAATTTRAPPASAVSGSLGGHITSRQRIMEKKGKEKLDLQSGPFKCNVCNQVCKTMQELRFHMRSVHPQPGLAATAAKETTFEWIRINNIGAGVNGPYNAMGRRIPAGAPTNAILALPASRAPIHQPPQGTMAMAGNPHFSAANTSTDRSFPGTTSNILPAIPLHNQEQNPQEQMAAVAPGNHRHHSINPALFSFSRRQEIAVVPSNDIASNSSTPRLGIIAATEPSHDIRINNHFVAIDAPANTISHGLPFFLSGRNDTQAPHVPGPMHHPTRGIVMDGNPLTGHFDTQALPVSWPMYHPTQGMAMDGNPLTGHFPGALSATGWSFPATTNNILPSIPLRNQEDGCYSFNPAQFSKVQEKNPLEEIAVAPCNAITSSTSAPHPGVAVAAAAAIEPSQAVTEVNSNVAAIDDLANTMRRLPFFVTGRSTIHAPTVSMPVHQPTQGMEAVAGNSVTGHFRTAMVDNGWLFSPTTSSVLPAIPFQTEEENPPQGRVVPTNEVADPPEKTVPSNNGGRTILLFGTIITEGPKEVKEPTN